MSALAELNSWSRDSKLLVVFLRHAGCTFCRETLSDLKVQRSKIESSGHRIVLVHMGQEDGETVEFFSKYGLGDVLRLSDPGQVLYRHFELKRGTLKQMFGLASWIRGFQAGILEGHGVGMLKGDGFQMPGAFVFHHGKILKAFRHRVASDRPDYLEFCGLSRG